MSKKVTRPCDFEKPKKDEPIGKKIDYERRKRGLSQQKLADKLGITKKTVIEYEKSKGNIPFKKIIEISKVLEVPTDYLLGLSEVDSYDIKENKTYKDIGLSNQTVKVLKEIKKYDSSLLDTINFLIQQETMFPVTAIGFEAPADISQEELEKLEIQAFEKVEQEENKWNNKHFTIIGAIDKFLNVEIPSEEIYVTKNSIKKEEDFNTQFQKMLHTKKKIDIKKIVDTALLSDINTELRKAKKYLERGKQNKK